MNREVKNSIPKDLQDKINDTVNEYARSVGDNDGVALNSRIRSMLNDENPETRNAGTNAAVDTIKTLAPKIFLQFVDTFGGAGKLEEDMMDDFWGYYDEGNGMERFVLLPEAPQSTNLLTGDEPFIPNKISSGYSQRWELKYTNDAKTALTKEAYAFKQGLVYQQTSLLTQFRTGAGLQYLIELVQKLYESLVYTQYDNWAKRKFAQPTATQNYLKINGTAETALTAWSEVFAIIEKMCKNTKSFNYNNTFKNMSTHTYEDIVIYCSATTANTFNTLLLSQLFNSTAFAKVANAVKVVVPRSMKLKWVNTTNSNITITSKNEDNTSTTTTINANANNDPVQGAIDIPSGLLWEDSGEEYINDNQIFITTKDSFMWIKQSHLEAKQFFANNFTDLTMLYEMGAMTYRPNCKMRIYENTNLNTNPSTIGVN